MAPAAGDRKAFGTFTAPNAPQKAALKLAQRNDNQLTDEIEDSCPVGLPAQTASKTYTKNTLKILKTKSGDKPPQKCEVLCADLQNDKLIFQYLPIVIFNVWFIHRWIPLSQRCILQRQQNATYRYNTTCSVCLKMKLIKREFYSLTGNHGLVTRIRRVRRSEQKSDKKI
jgi:hypothetical protein